MRRFTTLLLLAFAVLSSSLTVAAEKLNARGRKELEGIRAVMQENFQAANEEHVDRVMATQTLDCPQRETFREELKQFFEDTDCYTRLLDLRFVEADQSGTVVTVTVVQETLVAEEDENAGSDFRTHSAMLPPWPICAYEVEFHKVRGKWLIHEIVSEPREVTKETLACKDGECPLGTYRD